MQIRHDEVKQERAFPQSEHSRSNMFTILCNASLHGCKGNLASGAQGTGRVR